ncbi:hypothetical protein WH50_03180 [Pokkaliibacter plantistimulans]|uniref:DUF4440 domain-containing protein n=1 Tax=Pokkaliibacter plantistimulans TaxID=1635171 RepID=A0ABX5M170_9GAMM|nr:hypothetical protein [Pokkaliibacter plantistimulans]PXF32666.1 hypothetical protein WH50_03180 [Pokkaliibacter plantistimulans]
MTGLTLTAAVLGWHFFQNNPDTYMPLDEKELKELESSLTQASQRQPKAADNGMIVSALAEVFFGDRFNFKDHTIALQHPDADLAKYVAVITEDGIPEDDSVAGYRHRLTFTFKHGAWQIQKAEMQWRCWFDRGHTDFSTEPCR